MFASAFLIGKTIFPKARQAIVSSNLTSPTIFPKTQEKTDGVSLRLVGRLSRMWAGDGGVIQLWIRLGTRHF